MKRPLLVLVTAACAVGAVHAQYRRPYDPRYEQPPRYQVAPQPATVAPPFSRGAYVVRPQVLNRIDDLPFARDRVIVFVAPNCPQCELAVQYARETANRPVEVMDVTTPYAAQQFAALRVSAVPATVAGTQILLGADLNGTRSVLGGAGMRENNPGAP